jgi:outer membrane putative beta-barrel porin/alpha-amylase
MRDDHIPMNTSSVLGVLCLLLIAPTASLAQNERWQVGSAPSFSSGRYGTDTSTEVLQTPITARRLFDAGDLTVVFPFTCIWGNGGVTVVNGAPVRKELSAASGSRVDSTASRPDAGTTSGRPGTTSQTTRALLPDESLRPGAGTLPAKVTVCGMGDITVRGRYYLLDERSWLPTIAVRAHVKTPTASADRGLGTGRPDEGVGLEISRMFGRGLMAMVDGGYTVIGKPADVDYNDSWWYDVGIGQNLANGTVNVSVFYEEYAAIVPGLVSARDVLAAVSMKGAAGWRVQAAGQFGLSDSAPDRGFTFGASRRF